MGPCGQALSLPISTPNSDIARASPGGQATHPEDQNEEENEERLRKNKRTYREMRTD